MPVCYHLRWVVKITLQRLLIMEARLEFFSSINVVGFTRLIRFAIYEGWIKWPLTETHFLLLVTNLVDMFSVNLILSSAFWS